jgi:uncharacterized protein (TIGR00251 family)
VAASDPPLAAFDPRSNTLTLRVHALPGAKRNAIDGVHGGRLKVRIAARPIDGEANAVLCAFIAGTFGVPKRAVAIVAGHSGRAKTLTIAGPTLRPDRAWLQSPAG